MSSASRTPAKRIRHAPFRRAPSCPFGLVPLRHVVICPFGMMSSALSARSLVPLRHDVICRLRRPFGGSHTALSGFVQVLRASLSPTRVSVVPNAVDTTVFTPDISRQDQAARPRWHAPFRRLRGPVLVVRRGMGPLLSGMGPLLSGMAVRGCLLQDRLTIVVITRLVYRKVPSRSSAASARCALLNCAHAGCLAARCECVRMCMRVRWRRVRTWHAFALRDSSGLTRRGSTCSWM